MIKESEVPRWVWEGLKEKWSKIKKPGDPEIAHPCAMCGYIYDDMKVKDCDEICPLSTKWCNDTADGGVLGSTIRPVEEWTRNVTAFNRYIEEQLEANRDDP